MDEEVHCGKDHALLIGVSCLKNPDHAGTHAWWFFVDGVSTFLTWGRREP